MISAWHSTQHLKLGLFSDTEAHWSPLAPDEKSKKDMRPFKPENIEAHDLWIKFIQERIEIAKYCSQVNFYYSMRYISRFFWNILNISNSIASRLVHILESADFFFFLF